MRWILAISLLLFASLSSATTVYVSQAGGTYSGTSDANCTNGVTSTITIASITWTAGNTYVFCGTFSYSPGTSSAVTVGASGTSGNPITLLGGTSTNFTATYWSTYAINLNGHSYITVNGLTIQATANGTGLANQADNGVGIGSSGSVSNVIIENTTIANMYQHTCTEPVSNCTDENGQDVYGIELPGGSNISVSYNTIHDVKWALTLVYGYGYTTSTGFLVFNNTIYNMDHGIVFGDYGYNACTGNAILSSSNSSSAIYNNDFSAMQPWDATGDVNHHDAIHLWANCAGASSSEYTGVSVYSNYFHGAAGATCNTIFGAESVGATNYVFNNIINATGASDLCSTGFIGKWTGTGANGTAENVLNNTISPSSGSSSASSQTEVDYEETSSGVFENNLLLTGTGTYIYTDGTSGTLATADHNYYQTPAGGNPFYGPSGCNGGASFSAWQSPCGFDTHGHNANITVNSAPFTLPSGSAGIGAGANLTSLGITALDTGAPQNFGVTGSCGTGCIARPSSGAWDVGAYPYSSAGPTVTPAPAPWFAWDWDWDEDEFGR